MANRNRWLKIIFLLKFAMSFYRNIVRQNIWCVWALNKDFFDSLLLSHVISLAMIFFSICNKHSSLTAKKIGKWRKNRIGYWNESMLTRKYSKYAIILVTLESLFFIFTLKQKLQSGLWKNVKTVSLTIHLFISIITIVKEFVLSVPGWWRPLQDLDWRQKFWTWRIGHQDRWKHCSGWT